MITVSVNIERVTYNRIPEIRNAVNNTLLNDAKKIADKNNEQIDYDSINITSEEIVDSGCGCVKQLKVTLTVNTKDEYIIKQTKKN